jgi:hypothetical protein
MPSINASVTGQPQIQANVGETQIDVSVGGGFGPSGLQGPAASIAVGTVTTGAPGSSASVVNAGTSSAAVLNFTIPAGQPGATGATGATGPAGTTTWAGITDKPSTFSPSTHTHDDRYYTEGEVDTLLAGKQAAGSYAASSHAHVAANISDFTAAVIAAAPPTTNASLLTSGTLPDARLSNNIARTSDVTSAVAAVVNAAPASLDTLKELADALGNDASFATTVTNSLASKAPLANPTFTGTVNGITKSMVGLGSVDNTADAAKPISTATQTALNGKAATQHTHGNIDPFGAIGSGFVIAPGSVGGPVVFEATGGVVGRGAFGTQAGNVCQGNDSRLSDSREWSAATVSQADAEAGASTSRFAFTPARVFQAIAAWWAASAAKTKLDGIATGATANSSDATLLARANHTGTQAVSTIGGLQAALDGKASSSHTHTVADVTGAVSTSDSRLTDARTPTGAAGGDLTGTYPNPTIAAGAVVTADLADGAVTAAKIADSAVTDAKISAVAAGKLTGTVATARLGSGTASASNFLRGDGTWAAAPVTSVNGQTGDVTVAASAKKFWWM